MPAAPPPETDLIVLSYSAAGAAAALTAARAGDDVVVWEKQASERHTPSIRMSGGLVMGVSDVAGATDYLDRCAAGMVPREVSSRWAGRADSVIDWLAAIGPSTTRIAGAEPPDLPGAEGVTVHQPGSARYRLDAAGGAGTQLYEALTAAVTRNEVRVQWSSPVDRLLRAEAGRVTGVRLAGADGYDVSARQGVVLCCGGHEFDEGLKLDHLRAYAMHFYCNPGNTGDGVRTAQAVGADLWHMNQMVGRAIGSFPGQDGSPLNIVIGIDPTGYVITVGAGRRFAEESQQARLLHGFYFELLKIDSATGRHPRIPCYWFFDERRCTAGPLTSPQLGASAVGLYTWSADNSAELDRGWIHRGQSVAEAARAAGMAEPEAAAATVTPYNAGCAAGTHPLGRRVESLIPLDQPPYYCVPLYPGGLNTTGGPRRNADAQIVDVFGEVIPGLYAAGELGQTSGLLYPADGSNLSEALCFGQIAAEWALAQ